jgi:hypothetical protein
MFFEFKRSTLVKIFKRGDGRRGLQGSAFVLPEIDRAFIFCFDVNCLT